MTTPPLPHPASSSGDTGSMRTTSRTTENVPFLQIEGAGYSLSCVPKAAPLCTPVAAEFGTPRQRAVTVRMPRLGAK